MSKLSDMLSDLDRQLEDEMRTDNTARFTENSAVVDMSNLRNLYVKEVATLRELEASLTKKQVKIESALTIIRKRLEINLSAMRMLGEH